MGISGRVILHIDLDDFFASVEAKENPEYADLPLIISQDLDGKGKVLACNNKAREMGISQETPIVTAREKYPNAVYCVVNMPLYKRISEDIANILRSHADALQQVSINEFFIDASIQCLDIQGGLELAKRIREEIKDIFQLTCSIGIAPNKTVAKMASQMNRPDAITAIEQDKVREFLSSQPVHALPGIGEKTKSKLREFGIQTIAQLAKVPESDLVQEFNVWGTRLHYLANGIDTSEVKEEEGIRSVTRYHTFEEDVYDTDELRAVLGHLMDESFDTLKKDNLKPRTVGVKIRFQDFETHTKDRTRSMVYKNAQDAKETAYQLLEIFLNSNKRIKLVGIRLSNVEPATSTQKTVEEFF